MERRLSMVGGVPLIGRRFVAWSTALLDRLTLLLALER